MAREQSPIDKLISKVIQIPMSNSHFVQFLDIARELYKEEKEAIIQAFIDGGDHEALTKSNNVREDAEKYFDEKFRP